MNTDTTTGDGATGQVTDPAAGSSQQETQQQTSTPATTTEQQTGNEPEADGNPFDFMNMPDNEPSGSNEEQTEQESQQQTQEEAYELDLGEKYDGNPETRSLLTECAKEAKLPAKQTGVFVQAVAHRLNALQQQREQAANEGLKTHWGVNYSANMTAAGRFLRQVAQAEGFTEEETQQLMNPVVFRLALRAERAFSEGVAGKAGAPVSNKEILDSILDDPNNDMHKILMQPNHAKYRQTANYVNGLAGMKLF